MHENFVFLNRQVFLKKTLVRRGEKDLLSLSRSTDCVILKNVFKSNISKVIFPAQPASTKFWTGRTYNIRKKKFQEVSP